MIKTAKQLKDLIRNLSKEKSADAQLLMRNYMMERFLERISLSEHKDKSDPSVSKPGYSIPFAISFHPFTLYSSYYVQGMM